MLDGIKIIEMATYIAAPGAAGILADWGADVIKVEPLSGCPMRGFLGNIGVDNLKGNPVFELDNRGKRGIAINTGTPEGVEAVKRLVKDADVFITNVRPGGLERSGLDYKVLSQINPGLIYASVTGYGLEGPDRDKPGFDVAAFYGRSGLGQAWTVKGQEPVNPRMAVGDHITSMATAAGILAALVERGRTGKGRLVEASLLRTGVYALGCDMAIQLMFGKLGSTKTRHEAVNPLGNYFKTADETWFTIVPRQGSTDWAPLCRVIGQPELEKDERFSSAKQRRANARELVDILDGAFATQPLDYWRGRLDGEDIVWSPLMSPAEVSRDPQAIAAGAFVDVPEHDGGGTFRSPAAPIRFDGRDTAPAHAAPVLGEHTIAVLEAAGYSETDLASLRACGAIA